MFENISSYLRDDNLIYTNINLVSPIISYDLDFFSQTVKQIPIRPMLLNWLT